MKAGTYGRLQAPSGSDSAAITAARPGIRRRRAHAAIVLGPWVPRRIPYDICWRTRPLWLVDGLGLPGLAIVAWGLGLFGSSVYLHAVTEAKGW